MKNIMTIIWFLSMTSTAFADLQTATQASLNQAEAIDIQNGSDSSICYSLGDLGQRLENMSLTADGQYIENKSNSNQKIAMAASTVVLPQRLKLKEFCTTSAQIGNRNVLDQRLRGTIEILKRFQEVYLNGN